MPPAARLTDAHVCPLWNVLTPHVGGPIMPPCFPQVMTGMQPQARVSDMATCAGPPDVIAMGAQTVLVGGLPAARMTDVTAHGGSIMSGLPTVDIGGPVFAARAMSMPGQFFGSDAKYGPFTIEEDPNDPTYQSRVLAALIRLDTTPNAHAAMDAIQGSGNTVTIKQYVPPPGWGPFNAYTTPDNDTDAKTPGTGTNSTIGWDPNVNGFGPPGTTPASSQPGSDVILAHEMIHAAHNATGTKGNGPTTANNDNLSEERNTTGLPAGTYNNPGNPADPLNGTALPDTTGGPYNENGVRNDYANRGLGSPGVPPPVPRPSYYPPTPTGGAGAPF